MAIPLRERLLGRFARLTNRFRVWYRLPFLLAMPTLVGHRVNMREHNLFDTERDPSLLKPLGGANPRDRREADGSYNDLGCPWMGMAAALGAAGNIVEVVNATDLEGDVATALDEGQVAARIGNLWELDDAAFFDTVGHRLAEEPAHQLGDPDDLLLAKLWVHRKAEHLNAEGVGHRKLGTRCVVGEGRLAMNWDGVVNPSGHPVVL